MPKISVLVPCYNVEKYVGQCVESIQNQTLQDIEIICINDGSTDSTLEILKAYAEKDSRIKIIDKQNSGYGASMNMGLNTAQGEYIGIVESDDFIKNTKFEDLYNLAQKHKAQIVKSDYYHYFTDKNLSRKAGMVNRFKTNKITNAKKYQTLLRMHTPIWTGIYNRDFMNKNQIRFLETPGASYQDTSFAFKTISLAERIVLTDKAYLYYRKDNVNSSVHSKGKVFAICDEYDEITEFINKHPEIKDFANTQKLIKQYSVYKWNLMRVSEEFREMFIDKFSETFKEYYNNGEITKAFLNKVNKKEFELLINNKVAYKKYVEKALNKESKEGSRRKQFSIRINSSRISIVLFGKQIIEIG